MIGKRKLVIFGLGDFARLAAVYFKEDSSYELVAFTADERYITTPEWLGEPVVAFEQIETLYPADDYCLFVAVGFKRVNKARAQVYNACKSKGYELANYVNSTAVCSGQTTMGDNCFILEKTIIQPFVSIGNDVIIWAGSHIGHDSTVGDHVFIAPCVAISGNVRVAPYCFIGINATLRDGISVGQGCVIGAGVTVLHDALAESVYAGRDVEPTSLTSTLKGF
jgi:sugar O-acyltransferase (sialic acid O-acetyltransferase NeuD family)